MPASLLWMPHQGPIPSFHCCGPHCPSCLTLPASWHRPWVPCLRGWSRLSGPLFQPSCVCPLCASANGSRSMFAVSTPAGAEGMRPSPPAAQVPWVQPPPWVVGVGRQAGSSPPMTHPFTHGTAGPRSGRCGEPARAALGQEQDKEGPVQSALCLTWELLAEIAFRHLKAKFRACQSLCRIPPQAQLHPSTPPSAPTVFLIIGSAAVRQMDR